MFCWCALVLLTLVPVVTGNHAGVKVKLTQNGLNYVAVNAIEQMLKHFELPEIKYLWNTFTGLQIQSWDQLHSEQTFVPTTGVTITVNSAKLYMTGNWAFIRSSRPFDLTLSTLDISATAAVKTDETGNITLSIEKCNAKLGRFDLNANSWLPDTLLSWFNKIVRLIAQRTMCSMMKTTIDGCNPQLATLKANQSEYAGIDFSMGPTVILKDSIEFSLKDIFFHMGQPKETHLSLPDFTLPSQNTKMLYIGISAFTINTLVADFHKSGFLSIIITDDMVPPLILTTTTFGAYIPEISEKYPNLKMMLEIKTAKDPVIKFEANNFVLNILSTVTAFVIQPENKQSQLFVLNLEGSINTQVYATEHKLKLALTLNNIEASIKETNIKTFQVTKLNSLLDMVIKVVMFPAINAHLEKEYTLPGYLLPFSIGKIHLVNTQVECNACLNTQGYLLIGTDVHIHENTSPEDG